MSPDLLYINKAIPFRLINQLNKTYAKKLLICTASKKLVLDEIEIISYEET